MDRLSLQIPQISISFASPIDPPQEPFSPFGEHLAVEEDAYRPALLSPPPTRHSHPRVSSPLRPLDPRAGKGLDTSRFQALLAATRERNGSVPAKKTIDLRKEIAVKVHKSKQIERRALFLSKVQAPPSPSATATPKTPPESPAIFHYSLPSPGLVSPLALYGSRGLEEEQGIPCPPVSPWVEQVDFRMPINKKPPVSNRPAMQPRTSSLPSLDQIRARLSTNGNATITRPSAASSRAPARLPSFLRSESTSKSPSIVISDADAAPPTPRPRLNLPFGVNRQGKPAAPKPEATKPSAPSFVPPVSPRSPVIEVTTTIVPRSTNASTRNLTESNVFALNSRVRTARDMMSTLQRRMSGTQSACGDLGRADATIMDERKARRISAPAELPRRERCEFSHPVLNIPGGF